MADIAPFGLRMQPDLKNLLEREAKINGRSLNAEVVDRLKKSLAAMPAEQNPPLRTGEESRADSYFNGASDVERQLLTIFRRMPVEKQLALLSLFK